MDPQARNSIRHLTQLVERLMVRLQQAEAHIEELSQRVADMGVSTDRLVGAHPALGGPYGLALTGTALEDMYKRIGKEILENNKSDSDIAEEYQSNKRYED